MCRVIWVFVSVCVCRVVCEILYRQYGQFLSVAAARYIRCHLAWQMGDPARVFRLWGLVLAASVVATQESDYNNNCCRIAMVVVVITRSHTIMCNHNNQVARVL